MRFDTHACSSPGSRSINEDALSYCSGGGAGVWVVADGLGGHSLGELASKTVVDYVAEQACGGPPEDEQACLALLEDANRTLMEKRRLGGHTGMLTTLVAAFAAGGLLRPANVGDSRLYYFRGNALHFQTKDHSMSQLAVDMGEITPDGIRFHDDRSALTKVLGNSETLGLKSLPPPIPLQAGDAFLLCTDGFWEYVLEGEMLSALGEAQSARQWLDAMLTHHAARVEETSGGKSNDNYTAVCCRVEADGE